MTTQAAAPPLTLKYVKTIGIVNNGFNGRGFAYPYDLAVSADGRIFVLNRWEKAPRVGICNLDEDYVDEFGGGFGKDEGQFTLPVSVAFDSEERLYVSDEYLNRVSIFNTDGELLGDVGRGGLRRRRAQRPVGHSLRLRRQPVRGRAEQPPRPEVFTQPASSSAGGAASGDGPGEFNMPWGVALDSDGNVYVGDWRNDRVQKLSPDGCHIASFGEPGEGEGQLQRPAGVAVDGNGNVYVADWGNERVQVFAPDGSLVALLRGEGTLSKWATEFLAANPDEMVVREKSNLFPDLPPHLSSPYQVSSQTEPYFWGPVSVTLDGQGHLYVTETNRHRFQVYDVA